MAFTPSGWIPSLGPLAGSQVPERSWRGTAADFDSAAASACCGRAPAASAAEEASAATRTVTKALERFNIFTDPSLFLRGTPVLLAAALAGFLQLLEEAGRAFAVERTHDVAFALLLVEFNREPLATEFRGLLLLAVQPFRIVFACVHENAEFGQRPHMLRRIVGEEPGKAGYRPEVLRVERGDVERAQSSIGNAGDVKFVLQNFEIGKQLDEKCGKDARAILEEQISIGRRRKDDDITQSFR